MKSPAGTPLFLKWSGKPWGSMVETHASGLSLLPSVEVILSDERLADLALEPRVLVRAWAREVLGALRDEIRAGTWSPKDRAAALDQVIKQVQRCGEERLDLHLRGVWNATGVLLHTNLGRAVLPEEARRALLAAASGYTSLEIDLATGKRTSRLKAIRRLIPLLTGAEAGFAVTNNAAALFLTMASLAGGREVLVSRGELVEIGGSFRLPEILEAAGVRLREVGTTNRTRIGDYERARSAETALVLQVHRSNFRMVGFSEDAPLHELAAFCRREALPLVCDIGSGALRQHRDLFGDEPIVEEVIEAGADVVCFSADKLLGIGQAGIVAGRRSIVEDTLLRHPIARVVRLDKTLLAVLEAGLRIQLKGPEISRRRIPLLNALCRRPAAIADAAARCAARIGEQLGNMVTVGTIEVSGEIGGGSLPGITYPSHAVTLAHAEMGVDKLAAVLRAAKSPVIGRIQDDQLLLDLRAIMEEDEEEFVRTVIVAIGGD